MYRKLRFQMRTVTVALLVFAAVPWAALADADWQSCLLKETDDECWICLGDGPCRTNLTPSSCADGLTLTVNKTNPRCLWLVTVDNSSSSQSPVGKKNRHSILLNISEILSQARFKFVVSCRHTYRLIGTVAIFFQSDDVTFDLPPEPFSTGPPSETPVPPSSSTSADPPGNSLTLPPTDARPTSTGDIIIGVVTGTVFVIFCVWLPVIGVCLLLHCEKKKRKRDVPPTADYSASLAVQITQPIGNTTTETYSSPTHASSVSPHSTEATVRGSEAGDGTSEDGGSLYQEPQTETDLEPGNYRRGGGNTRRRTTRGDLSKEADMVVETFSADRSEEFPSLAGPAHQETSLSEEASVAPSTETRTQTLAEMVF